MKRHRNTTCYECVGEDGEHPQFFSRKLRHHHQMVNHRGPKLECVKLTSKARRAKPLYAAHNYPL